MAKTPSGKTYESGKGVDGSGPVHDALMEEADAMADDGQGCPAPAPTGTALGDLLPDPPIPGAGQIVVQVLNDDRTVVQYALLPEADFHARRIFVGGLVCDHVSESPEGDWQYVSVR